MSKRNDSSDPGNFINFLFKKERGLEVAIYLLVSLGLMFLLLFSYPYPVMTEDSGNYVLHAREMSIGAYRPYGYSAFLSMLHSLSADIRVIYYGQFALNFVSTLIFILTIQYLFSLKRILLYAFAAILLIFPTALYSTVLIMSDSLFYSLSLLYIASMLWFLRSRKWWLFLAQMLILYFLLHVRYVALIYPFVTAFGIGLGKFTYKKLALATVPLIILGLFYSNVKAQMKERFNIEIFSGFSGWALANNAVSVIPYIDLEPEDIKDPEVRYVHSFVSQLPDSVYDTDFIIRTDFMWDKNMSAKKMMQDYRKYKPTNYPRLWLYSGEILNKYGKFLIKKYPWLYIKHFIVPNFCQLFKTFEIKELKTFNKLNLKYFEYPVEKYEYVNPLISRFYVIRKVSTTLLWVLFFCSVVYIIIKRKNIHPYRAKGLVFMAALLLAHSFLSIVAHPINNFRYLIPIYPTLVLSVLYAINLFLSGRKP